MNLHLMVFIQKIIHIKIKDGAYVVNFDELKSVRTHWIASYSNDNNVTCFDSFSVEHITKEI